MSDLTFDEFMKDIKDHAMVVKLDNGLYRHLRFRKQGSFEFHFDLITYPGGLLIRGDCGAYCFERLDDMFAFFRKKDGPITINPEYWAEKCQAQDRTGSIKEYDEVLFKSEAQRIVREHFEEDLEEDAADALEALELHLSWEDISNEPMAREAFQDFEYKGWKPTDIWEYSFQVFSRRYQWNLYAIVWGIEQYDAFHRVQNLVVKP